MAVSIDGQSYGNATYGISRPDVCSALGNHPGCPNVGWSITIDTAKLSGGSHNFTIKATTTDGRQTSLTTQLNVKQAVTTTDIDAPTSSNTYLGTQVFGGWVVDNADAISTISVKIDGTPRSASYGTKRTDVCAAMGNDPGCPNVGWDMAVDTALLSGGAHSFTLAATTTDGRQASQTATLNVKQAVITTDIDAPNPSHSYLGSQIFGGWALDNADAISSIAVTIDGRAYSASYGTARSDVCAGMGNDPGCPNVGWNMAVDTALLSPGSHTFTFSATTSDGRQASQTTTLNVQQAVTNVNIDIPASQQVYKGGQLFSGWAIDNATTISGVTISIDGISYGATTYGNNRGDVCTALGAHPGCPNVGWQVTFNTTQLKDGQHTLTATATTSDGRTANATSVFSTANSSQPPADPRLAPNLPKKDYIHLAGQPIAIENQP